MSRPSCGRPDVHAALTRPQVAEFGDRQPAGTRKVRMPSTHIGMAVQPPPAMIDDPVIQQMMNT